MSRTTLDMADLTPAGLLRRRNERCKETTSLFWTDLCALVAIIAHYRAFGVPVARRELNAFLLAEEGFACDKQIGVLYRAGLIEKRGNSARARYLPTARGSAKVGAWRRAQVGEREEVAAAE